MTEMKLRSVQNECALTAAAAEAFSGALQKAVLLSLKEDGEVTEMQCRFAEEMLHERCTAAKNGMCRG